MMRRQLLFLLSTCAAMLALAALSHDRIAQANKSLMDDLKSDILADLEGNSAAKDLEGIRTSHLSQIESWDAVEPYSPRQKKPGEKYLWKVIRGSYVSPLASEP